MACVYTQDILSLFNFCFIIFGIYLVAVLVQSYISAVQDTRFVEYFCHCMWEDEEAMGGGGEKAEGESTRKLACQMRLHSDAEAQQRILDDEFDYTGFTEFL